MTITIDLPEGIAPDLQDLVDQSGSAELAAERLIRKAAVRRPSVAATSYEDWKIGFESFLSLAKPYGTDVSYDREAAYPEVSR